MNENAKGNTMYESIPVVAELNRVAGFEPLKFARKVTQEGTGGLLLDLKYKKLWFRLKYPQGRIRLHPLKITEQLAIIEATVFFDKRDKTPTASFIAQRYAKDTPGGLYIESAQYAAVDKALSDAGFGVQFTHAAMTDTAVQTSDAVVEKVMAPVAKPIVVAAPTVATEETIAPALAENASQEQRLTQAMPVEIAPVAPEQADEPTPMVQTAVTQEKPQGVQEPPIEPQAATVTEDVPPIAEATPMNPPMTEEPVQAAPVVEAFTIAEELPQEADSEEIAPDAAVSYTPDMPVDSICLLMTLAEARDLIVDVGTCKGWTLAQVSERRAASLKWYLGGYQGDNNILKAGAKLLLENLTMDKAS